MIEFLLSCFAMLSVVALLFVPSLFKRNIPSDTPPQRWLTLISVTLVVAAISAGFYFTNTKWSWAAGDRQLQAGDAPDVSAMIARQEEQLKKNPNDIDGWVMLGRSYVITQRYALGTNAYQQAYDLSQGQNIDATIGLAEALVLTDENSLQGRASTLIEQVLKQQPNNPKALWYGGLAALKTEKLAVARQRFAALLALNPPQQIRTLLERQVQDLDQQLGTDTAAAKVAAVADSQGRKIIVSVKLAESLQQQLKEPISLFVLARDPQKGGVPLAVERHQSSELPLRVELTAADAMLPTRSINDVAAVEVVARLSRSGTPLEQSGDYVGTAHYSFTQQGQQGAVTIEINRQVP